MLICGLLLDFLVVVGLVCSCWVVAVFIVFCIVFAVGYFVCWRLVMVCC